MHVFHATQNDKVSKLQRLVLWKISGWHRTRQPQITQHVLTTHLSTSNHSARIAPTEEETIAIETVLAAVDEKGRNTATKVANQTPCQSVSTDAPVWSTTCKKIVVKIFRKIFERMFPRENMQEMCFIIWATSSRASLNPCLGEYESKRWGMPPNCNDCYLTIDISQLMAPSKIPPSGKPASS